MLRAMLFAAAVAAGVWAFDTGVQAQKPTEGKEVKLTGTLVCGHSASHQRADGRCLACARERDRKRRLGRRLGTKAPRPAPAAPQRGKREPVALRGLDEFFTQQRMRIERTNLRIQTRAAERLAAHQHRIGSTVPSEAAVEQDTTELTNDVAVADDEAGFFSLELQVLRDQADGGEREDVVVVADFRVAVDHC